MTLRVLIVDDEPWARKRIATLLKAEEDVEIIGECKGGAEAVQAIMRHPPDLVFLDIQMPEVDGFNVIETVGPDQMPLVIFVTAYDKYAIQAFDAQALDYLLKPFDNDRFRQALGRARKELREKISSGRVFRDLLDSLRQEKALLQRLVVRSGGHIIFLKVSEVDWIESSGNYVTVHAGKESYMLRTTMHSLQPRLDPGHFIRIHRSTIVNLDRVREVQRWFHGKQVLVLKDGTRLNVGHAFRESMLQLAGNSLR